MCKYLTEEEFEKVRTAWAAEGTFDINNIEPAKANTLLALFDEVTEILNKAD